MHAAAELQTKGKGKSKTHKGKQEVRAATCKIHM